MIFQHWLLNERCRLGLYSWTWFTYWNRHKMDAILQMIFWNPSPCMEIVVFGFKFVVTYMWHQISYSLHLTEMHSTTICKLVDLIPALHQSDCRIPNCVSVKTVHSSSTNCTARNLHTSGIDAGHVEYKNVSLQTKLQPVKFYIGYFLRFHSIIV